VITKLDRSLEHLIVATMPPICSLSARSWRIKCLDYLWVKL
jgi:hypothetical protein